MNSIKHKHHQAQPPRSICTREPGAASRGDWLASPLRLPDVPFSAAALSVHSYLERSQTIRCKHRSPPCTKASHPFSSEKQPIIKLCPWGRPSHHGHAEAHPQAKQPTQRPRVSLKPWSHRAYDRLRDSIHNWSFWGFRKLCLPTSRTETPCPSCSETHMPRVCMGDTPRGPQPGGGPCRAAGRLGQSFPHLTWQCR